MKKLSKEEMKKVIGGEDTVDNPDPGDGGGSPSNCYTYDSGCMAGFSCWFSNGVRGMCGVYYHGTKCGCVGGY